MKNLKLHGRDIVSSENGKETVICRMSDLENNTDQIKNADRMISSTLLLSDIPVEIIKEGFNSVINYYTNILKDDRVVSTYKIGERLHISFDGVNTMCNKPIKGNVLCKKHSNAILLHRLDVNTANLCKQCKAILQWYKKEE